MSTRIALTHRIERQFGRRLSLPTPWLRLRPAPHARGIEAYSLRVHAQPHFLNWARDPYGNHIARLDLPEPLAGLALEVDLVADLAPVNPFDFLVEPYASRYPFEYPDELRKELSPYLRGEPVGDRWTAWSGALDRTPAYVAEFIAGLNRQLRDGFSLAEQTGTAAVDLDGVLASARATAWELAWLLTLSLRSLGMAARFTSGYRVRLAGEGGGADAAFPHAWSEVYLPGAGWVGLDPVEGLFVAEGYIPLASGPTPQSAAPLVGLDPDGLEQREQTLRLRRLRPRPAAWPYDEGSWADIRALGGLIGADLQKLDLRATVTTGLSLVAAYQVHEPEWSTVALGPSKRILGEDLLARLWPRLAPGGVLQTGQGEWYGGEQLPRWRLNGFARADGRPVWRNPELLCRNRRPFGLTADNAANFARTLARRLGLPGRHVTAAYEDGLHELWTRRIAFPCGPSAEQLGDPERRRILASRLSETVNPPKAYLLPIRWDGVANRWTSGSWSFRRGALYLMPGDSPAGYRLPLDSLPAADGNAPESDPERCQFDERPPLAQVCGEPSARYTSLGPPAEVAEEADADGPAGRRPPRTALCVETRGGRLHVFLPPLTHLEHYLDLLAAIEDTAAELVIPVVLEGYEPPEDCRLLRLSLEPDAGTLRLYLPAAESLDRHLANLRIAYEEAASAGLRCERILADGRRLPPGGRMELALGGTTPADSPFLRRPELLRSLIGYWQRHPCLSYFFAGRSIGPGGVAPRPDEGRDDALYELAIALERMPAGEHPYPWVTDRLLRHLLTDPGGDIRAAEIRIDALYPPDRAALRLGRIVLRSFESPPDQRMAALQSLLVFALLAHFARRPQLQDLTDWGEALHDRFMLPWMLWQDLETVLGELREAGYPFRPEWFQPFLDLHFPILGSVQAGDLGLELRAALEPWPLLAEEITAAGKARFIDSANQRLQVHCTGLVPGRYVLTCNGRRVPLRPTGIRGEYLAGVRFKASNPPSTLHPTKLPLAALVFDLTDGWSGRVVGGCTYIPPQPDVVGVAGIPPLPPEPGDGRVELPRRMPPISLPPWSSGGEFRPVGGGLTPSLGSAEDLDPRHPYLLDLSRLT